jgi:hypothetical protein
VLQAQSGNWAPRTDAWGYAVNELEGYDWEIRESGRTGLSGDDLASVRQLRSQYYEEIRGTPYQSRVDGGNYQLVTKPENF